MITKPNPIYFTSALLPLLHNRHYMIVLFLSMQHAKKSTRRFRLKI